MLEQSRFPRVAVPPVQGSERGPAVVRGEGSAEKLVSR